MDLKLFTDLTRQIRYDILRMTRSVGSGHPTSCFSAVELVTLMFFKYFRFDLDNPEYPGNDRLIFSKGHASALYYALFAAAGKINEEELLKYRTFGSPLEGHPTRRFLFTEVATGSLGQGLSIGAGEAWVFKSMLNSGNQHIKACQLLPRVFVLLGDGEMAEGANWEAAAWANKHKLNNLIAIVDVNRLGQTGETAVGHDCEIYRRRFEAFGWGAIVVDGHDFSQIDTAIQKALDYKVGPSVIIAKTVKGKGIAVWEDQPNWHNRMLPAEELKKALAEYQPEKRVVGKIVTPESTSLKLSKLPRLFRLPKYKNGDLVPTKRAWGDAVVALGESCPELIVLDGDMANSTHADQFAAKFPERFLEMYIAEQNMVGVAVGVARRGLKPFMATFAAFLTRAHDQFRMAPLSGANLYINGSYVGVSLGRDGPSQMGLEDIALFRSIQDSTVLYPADAVSTAKLTAAMLWRNGVNYIRTTREPTRVIYGPDEEFPIGRSKIHPSHLREFPFRVSIVAAGITLHEALKAQKELEKENIVVQVIDCYSIKPIDEQALRQAAANAKVIVVVEDHYSQGGLGEAVKSALADIGRTSIVHLAVTKLPRSGSSTELLDWAGISARNIEEVVRSFRQN